MRNYPRSRKVEALIQEELSVALLQKIHDPRLSGVTITGVKVSEDLSTARVFFCVPDRANAKRDAEDGFKKAAGFIRRELSAVLGLRYMPEIHFNYDESLDYGRRIDDVLRGLSTGEEENEG